MWTAFQIGLAGFVGALLLIAAFNLFTWRRLGHYPQARRLPRISILVPARNEADNIAPCVRSLLAQQYPDFEVIALDDESTDGTAQILAELAASDDRLRVIAGEPLPRGWLGKHWACQQLARAARGELLLFTDADTRHHPRTVRDAVAALEAERADLLSALPRQETLSWAERLTVPVIPWSILSFIPIALAHRVRRPAWSAAIGQFMLFRREAYERIGGHASVRQHAVDDLALARRARAEGLRWRLLDGADRIRCRMYRNFKEIGEGLSKNLFAAFDYKAPQFVFVWTWLAVVFAIWPALLALSLIGVSLPEFSIGLAAASVLGSLVLWALVLHRSRLHIALALLYPLSVLLAASIALRSLALTRGGRTIWKGRTLAGRKART